jgi:Ni/Fe-hydrogenase subunit HybB-like protein
MSDLRPQALKTRFFTPGALILTAVAAVGLAFGLARIFNGLGAVTNLDNFYPWGIWPRAASPRPRSSTSSAASISIASSGRPS